MRDPDVNVLWIRLCRVKQNAQDTDLIKKTVTTHEIHTAGIDKSHIMHAIETHRPGLICVDYDFPDLPGLRLLRLLRSGHPHIPIIMLTTQHNESLAVWAFRTGVRNYLVKPLPAKVIVEEISVLLAAQFRSRSVTYRGNTPRINVLKSYPIPNEFRFATSSLREMRTIPAVYYVETHYQERIVEKEVADFCSMNIFTFSRIFRIEHKMTFREFLIKYRIEQAKELLHNPEIAITDVAHLIGFTDASSFTRLFRRYVSMTPSCYQKTR